jgi:hypothetical protein
MDMGMPLGVAWLELTVQGPIPVARVLETSCLCGRDPGLKRPCLLGFARVVEGGGARM